MSLPQNFRTTGFPIHKLHQRGAATLLVTMVFLLITSILMLYLNRNIIFEQKISANQMRSTKAFEMAEAGIEWATGMLNSANYIGTDCNGSVASTTSFRDKYVFLNWNNGSTTATNVAPATTTFPGCKIDSSTNTWACSCPNVVSGSTATASLGTSDLPSFTLSFSAESSDVEAVRVTAIGCTAQTSACTPSTASNADATSTVSVILKLRAELRAVPAATLTCGTSCTTSGSFNVTNQDLNTGGVVANSGGATSLTGGTNTTLPGLNPLNAVVKNDTSLSSLASLDPTCSNSAMFKTFFGSTIAEFKAAPATVQCTTETSCTLPDSTTVDVDAAYAKGWRSFYFSTSISRNNSSGDFGSAAKPVTIVTPGALQINGNIHVYGLIFANEASLNSIGTGNSNLHGALITCGAFNANGNGTLTYDATTLSNLRISTATVTRVPASWNDRCTLSTASPPVLSCN